jgi:hypothetical protein
MYVQYCDKIYWFQEIVSNSNSIYSACAIENVCQPTAPPHHVDLVPSI